MKTVYVCSDSVTGIFSAVYDAWKAQKAEEKCGIVLQGFMEQQLFCDFVVVEETEAKTVAVERMIRKHMGLLA